VTQANLVSNKKNNIDLVLSPNKNDSVITEASILELIQLSEYKDLYIDKNQYYFFYY
jgi:hypothetical protein